MITTKAKYGLKAMVVLAQHFPERALTSIGEIATREGIPLKFLEGILLDLKNQGLLVSKRGPGGGYSLARPPHKISVAQVLRVLDGPLAPVPCVSKAFYRTCPDCLDERTCTVRPVMGEVRDVIAQVLENKTLEDMAIWANRLQAPEAPMYYI